MEIATVIDQIVRRIGSRVQLTDGDRAMIESLPIKIRTLEPSTYLLREGQRPQRCAFIVDGFAYRQKLTPNGEREIVSILMPGEFVDVQNLFLDESDHDIQALTRITIAEVMIPALRDLALGCPAVNKALWIDALVEASTHREWLLNIGRRNAKTRMAHLLCEFCVRLQISAVGQTRACEMPMTQEQLGDALGLTPVHVNRIVRKLRGEGALELSGGTLIIADLPLLGKIAGFGDNYLHRRLRPRPAALG